MTSHTTFLLLIFLIASAGSSAAQPKQIAQGAQIWAMTCNRCHYARSPLERSDAAWGVIVSHMRTIANLTRSQSDAVTAFLKASNDHGEDDHVGILERKKDAPSRPKMTNAPSTRSILWPRSLATPYKTGRLQRKELEWIRQYVDRVARD